MLKKSKPCEIYKAFSIFIKSQSLELHCKIMNNEYFYYISRQAINLKYTLNLFFKNFFNDKKGWFIGRNSMTAAELWQNLENW